LAKTFSNDDFSAAEEGKAKRRDKQKRLPSKMGANDCKISKEHSDRKRKFLRAEVKERPTLQECGLHAGIVAVLFG